MIKEIFEYIQVLDSVPAPILKATFIILLVFGLIFFTTRSYDLKTTTSILNDFPVTKVSEICVDESGLKECQKFSHPKKVRITVITQTYQNDEKIIAIKTSE